MPFLTRLRSILRTTFTSGPPTTIPRPHTFWILPAIRRQNSVSTSTAHISPTTSPLRPAPSRWQTSYGDWRLKLVFGAPPRMGCGHCGAWCRLAKLWTGRTASQSLTMWGMLAAVWRVSVGSYGLSLSHDMLPTPSFLISRYVYHQLSAVVYFSMRFNSRSISRQNINGSQVITVIIYWNKHMCSEMCVASYPKCSGKNKSRPAETTLMK